jgi:hypothetical protein
MGPRPLRGPLMFGLAIFLAGFVLGVGVYAWLGPNQRAIDPYVQGALVAGVAALVAALLAITGSWWGASKSAESAVSAATITAAAARDAAIESARRARESALQERRGELIGQIVTGTTRHMYEVSAQLLRWVELTGSVDDSTMPVVGPTTPINDAVNGLYALGDQHLADLGRALLAVLVTQDQHVYGAMRDRDPKTGKIDGPSDHELDDFYQLQWMANRISTDLIVAGSRDLTSTPWKAEGTLPMTYLEDLRKEAIPGAREHLASIATTWRW